MIKNDIMSLIQIYSLFGSIFITTEQKMDKYLKPNVPRLQTLMI